MQRQRHLLLVHQLYGGRLCQGGNVAPALAADGGDACMGIEKVDGSVALQGADE